MAVIFDSDAVDPADRAEVLAAVLLQASAPSRIVIDNDGSPLTARFEAWELGRIGLIRTELPNLLVHRTPRLVKSSPTPAFQFAITRTGRFRYEQADDRVVADCGELFAVDLDKPYQGCVTGGGCVTSVFVHYDEFDLPTELLHRGTARLSESPLYPLVAQQINGMVELAESITRDAAARDWGVACVEMLRALVISAANAEASGGEALPQQVLLSRIREYVRRNLSNPDLSAAMIARAHNVSVRHLYKVCAAADFSLEQWIIAERLDRIRADLAGPELTHRSIAAIAASRGFRDHSHFARRFRAAFGMTPREWRATASTRYTMLSAPRRLI